MASYLRPRRGKKTTAESQGIVLKRGEIFFEVPSSGTGTGIGKIKMGDGTTAYNQLPYFLQQNIVGDETVAFTDTSAATASTNNGTYLSNIAPANNIKTLMTNIKQLLYNYNSQLTQLSTDIGNTAANANNRIAKINNTVDGPISQMSFNRISRRIYWWDEETGQGSSIIAGNFRLDGTTLYIDL